MADEALVESLRDILFADPDANVFTVLDGASVPDLLDHLYADDPGERPEFCCLFPGQLEPDMAYVAPYVAELKPDSEFTRYVLDGAWGKHWGIFGVSNDELFTLRWHFRNLVTVRGPDRKPLTFRFYDPRVLRVYLPTCNAGEAATFFGRILCYVCEDEDPNILLRFTQGRDAANIDRIPLAHATQA